MAKGLDARQLLSLAHEIEVIGRTAFERLAQSTADPRIASLFRGLAEDEGKHDRCFLDMRTRLAAGGSGVRVQGAEQAGKVKAVLAGFECRCPTDILRDLRGNESETELLRKVVEFEKGTVALFQRMRGCLLPGQDLESLDGIIAEELKHVSALQDRIEGSQSGSR